jgi:hypothetical protein
MLLTLANAEKPLWQQTPESSYLQAIAGTKSKCTTCKIPTRKHEK